jgi:hypothetical protein
MDSSDCHLKSANCPRSSVKRRNKGQRPPPGQRKHNLGKRKPEPQGSILGFELQQIAHDASGALPTREPANNPFRN